VRGYVKSDPHFFRRIKAAFSLAAAFLLGLAALIPAPLQAPADVGRVPNPAKSAWFLLWMQELVSYGTSFIYLILALGTVFLLLPFLPGSGGGEAARWFSRDHRVVNVFTFLVFLGIAALTVIAMFFRGENWSLLVPF
jgi:hypothetical protein